MREKTAKGGERRLTITLFYLGLLLGMKEGQESTTAEEVIVTEEPIVSFFRELMDYLFGSTERASIQKEEKGDTLCSKQKKVSL